MKKAMNAIIFLTLSLLISLLLGQKVGAATIYNISSSVDLSGGYADTGKSAPSYQKIFLAWWNQEIGKDIGVQLNVNVRDSHYDSTVVASYWPGVLSSEKPIIYMGFGGADVNALMKRLPQDKVPMVNNTGAYGYIWKPNQWIFQTRPTYPHECAGFASYLYTKLARKIRVSVLVAKGIAASEDNGNGIKNWCEKSDWAELAGIEYTPLSPVTLLTEMQRLVRSNPDFIYAPGTVASVVATIRALKQLGSPIPVVMSQHNSLMMTAKGLSLNEMEGHYDCAAMDPGLDKAIPAYKIFEKYLSAAPGVEWDGNATFWSSRFVLTCRAVERAAKMVGPDKITGEAVYNAMFSEPFTEQYLLGLLPLLSFTKEAPFSMTTPKVKISVIKDGKHVMATNEWVPIKGNVPKWE
jgi:branched-chain amino acid transport system substrate-binding protein